MRLIHVIFRLKTMIAHDQYKSMVDNPEIADYFQASN